MSIKKLQRYDYDTAYNGNTGQYQVIFFKEDEGFYCADKDVTELEATNAELVKALEELLGEITEMAELGECDSSWCADGKDAARKALASAKGE